MAIDNTYGLYFPVVISSGVPVSPGLEDSIDSSIRTILAWMFGTRYFLYTFGSIIEPLLGTPNGPTALALTERYIFKALRTWEPRVNFNSIVITQEEESLTLDIQGTIKETRTIYNFSI